MFIKINELYNFLTKSGYKSYANAIEKIALEESDFENKYPNIYSAWNEKRDKPLSAYLAQISRAEEKGVDLTKENINSFQDIIQILRGEKQKSKSSKADEILKALNKEGLFDITEENVDLAFGVGLNAEEIIYLAKDKCNHTWEEKLHYADRFKKERLSLFDENTKLTDFKDIDEVRDEFFSRKNTAPLDLQEFYERIKPEAIESSEVIYNSKNYIVAHSKSEKAAQYWEQSCVTVSEEGRVSSGLCSSHPDSSMFDYYDQRIHSFQIITKEYETLKETPRTSFMSKNKGYNLISLSINKKTGEVAWGGQDTVNRFNEKVGKSIFFAVLGEEYGEICKAIKDYCKKELSLEVKDLVANKDQIVLSVDEINNLGLDRKNFAFENSFKNADPNTFFEENYLKLDKKLFDKYSEEKAKMADSVIFLTNSENISEDLNKKLCIKKMKELSDKSFFFYEKEEWSEYTREFETKKINMIKILENNKYIPEEDMLIEAKNRAKRLDSELFFNCINRFPLQARKEILENNIIEKLEGLTPNRFMGYLPFAKEIIDSDYEVKDKFSFNSLVYKNAKVCDAHLFFEKAKHIPSRVFDRLVKDKLEGAPIISIVRNIGDKPLSYFKEIVYSLKNSKIENIELHELASYAGNLSSENLTFLIKEILKEEDKAYLFFMYRWMFRQIALNAEDLFELDKYFGSRISPSHLSNLREDGTISEAVFKEIKK